MDQYKSIKLTKEIIFNEYFNEGEKSILMSNYRQKKDSRFLKVKKMKCNLTTDEILTIDFYTSLENDNLTIVDNNKNINEEKGQE